MRTEQHKRKLFRIFAALMAALLLTLGICSAVPKAAAEQQATSAPVIELNSGCGKLSQTETEALINKVYAEYQAEALKDPTRIQETTTQPYSIQYMYVDDTFDVGAINYNGYTMRYGIQVIGQPDENGKYPLYIALHGGGSSYSYENDEQWEEMFYYYRDCVKNGIYVNVRGISDTWNLHFLDESYYMYDRLIEDMILFKNVDPNRVYVLGFSAGGDGVYAVTSHMADRFAAANMSSGHPNDILLTNLSNLPILLQAGIRDNWYDRNGVTVEAGLQLDYYRQLYGFGYEHEVLIHVPEGHNYNDTNAEEGSRELVVADLDQYMTMLNENYELTSVIGDDAIAYSTDDDVNDKVLEVVDAVGLKTRYADSNAVRWVSQYTRDPYPVNLVWDLNTRASQRTVQSFYYLKAPSATTGTMVAKYDRENNSVTIDASKVNGDFSILFNPFMLDLSKPVTVTVNDFTVLVNVAPSEECIRASLAETSDINRVYAAELTYSQLLAAAGQGK